MRQELVKQPVEIADEVFLCWNGEVYETWDDTETWQYGVPDTLLVAGELKKDLKDLNDDITGTQVARVIAKLRNAEFAMLILTKSNVFYCRDDWGRRSLLRWDCPVGCGSFQIVSTAETLETNVDTGNIWSEILPGTIHQIPLTQTGPSALTTHSQLKMTLSSMDPQIFDSKELKTNTCRPEGVSEKLWVASLELEGHLRHAVKMRLDQNAASAVLFSGGLDSAVIAAMAADMSTHPLYLFNVSFGPTYMKSNDRKAALIASEALKTRHPQKDIIFQDIVVDWDDIEKNEPHIRTLLQPKSTLMDVNIGIALWFASRGGDHRIGESDVTAPRVLLLGMGADEQLGGYGRHRKAYAREGLQGLAEELQMDQSRFWERNLGRDDRICADHGKEARFPFLDANVVSCLKGMPLDTICDFSLPPGQGDKRILRVVAARLGLEHASGLVKRAIQFGSRISHLSDAKRFGSRRKAKGEASVKPTPDN
eukprot:scaffold1605_cov141-Cylindrotheca_fusiformis.AAC.18